MAKLLSAISKLAADCKEGNDPFWVIHRFFVNVGAKETADSWISILKAEQECTKDLSKVISVYQAGVISKEMAVKRKNEIVHKFLVSMSHDSVASLYKKLP